MDLIVESLRKGAKKIISRHSPFDRKAEKGEFKIDSHPEREILFVLQGKSEFMLADWGGRHRFSDRPMGPPRPWIPGKR